jgi:hypothetical protein
VKYKVGDRIVGLVSWAKGSPGTIIHIFPNGGHNVRFDSWIKLGKYMSEDDHHTLYEIDKQFRPITPLDEALE